MDVSVRCQQCGVEFKARPAIIKRGGGKYCSKECAWMALRRRITVKCAFCGKAFEICTSRIKTEKYCSTKCSIAARKQRSIDVERKMFSMCEYCGRIFHKNQRIQKFCSKYCFQCGAEYYFKPMEMHPSYKGGTFTRVRNGKSYEYIRTTSDGRHGVALHRYKAEVVLGRKLKTSEIVHHIDGDPSNNNNNNLLVCDRGFHTWIHHKQDGSRFGRLTTGPTIGS